MGSRRGKFFLEADLGIWWRIPHRWLILAETYTCGGVRGRLSWSLVSLQGQLHPGGTSPKTGSPKSPTLPERYRKSSQPGKLKVDLLQRIKSTRPSHWPITCNTWFKSNRKPPISHWKWPLKSFSFIIFWPASCHLDRQVSSTPPDKTWVTWREARSPLFPLTT